MNKSKLDEQTNWMKKNKRNYFIIESLKKECTCNGIWIDKKNLTMK